MFNVTHDAAVTLCNCISAVSTSELIEFDRRKLMEVDKDLKGHTLVSPHPSGEEIQISFVVHSTHKNITLVYRYYKYGRIQFQHIYSMTLVSARETWNHLISIGIDKYVEFIP
jgi:hypothetical protein